MNQRRCVFYYGLPTKMYRHFLGCLKKYIRTFCITLSLHFLLQITHCKCGCLRPHIRTHPPVYWTNDFFRCPTVLPTTSVYVTCFLQCDTRRILWDLSSGFQSRTSSVGYLTARYDPRNFSENIFGVCFSSSY